MGPVNRGKHTLLGASPPSKNQDCGIPCYNSLINSLFRPKTGKTGLPNTPDRDQSENPRHTRNTP